MSSMRHPEAAAESNSNLQIESKPNDVLVTAFDGDRSASNDGLPEIAPLEPKSIGNMTLPPDTKNAKDGAMIEAEATSTVASGLPTLDEDNMQNSEINGTILATATTDDKTADTDPMESSTATLRPDPPSNPEANTIQSPAKGNALLDPAPQAPYSSVSLSASSNASTSRYETGRTSNERSPTRSDAGFDEKPSASEDEREGEPRSEIQSIMEQFSAEGGGPGAEEVMSPRLEFAGPMLGSQIQHPPRKSSLEPLNQGFKNAIQSLEDTHLANVPSSRRQSKDSEKGPEVPPKPASMHGLSPMRSAEAHLSNIESPISPHASSLHRPPPPEPEPEPDLPFDFHRFLEQLRHRTADPVAKFLRSFLLEFGKKQWMVHEQVKIIGDFLAFITNKMAQCEVWKEVSDAEFDNAREGMEKLVMNRLYTQTFSPAIPPPQPIPGSRPRRKNGERPLGPGRRGQHQEDVERDDILAQKVSIYGWVKEEHLDILPVGDSGKRFLILAQQGENQFRCYWSSEFKLTCCRTAQN